MDTGLGSFAKISERIAQRQEKVFKELSGVFTKGEELIIKGSHFKVDKIKKRGLRLLLLPNNSNLT